MPVSDLFSARIHSFAQLLNKLENANENISAYSNRYLQYLLKNRIYFLHIYASVLQNALEKSVSDFNETIILDYGSGNGLLGMFAKYCGCKKVFLCDTAKNFMDASAYSSDKLGITIDGFIHGDIEDFRGEFPTQKVDWVIGTDVIEHIYNLEHFFGALQQINPRMITVFTTASNPHNFIKVKKLRRMQLHDELEGGDPTDFELAGEEAHPSFLEMRKSIIKNYHPGVQDDIVLKLAQLTRGKIKLEIEEAVRLFHSEGIWPEPPEDKWNTCHPITGSWSERILSEEFYKSVYEQNGFHLQVSVGFYNAYSKSSKGIFNYFRNLLMKIMGKKFAPFITLSGFPKS